MQIDWTRTAELIVGLVGLLFGGGAGIWIYLTARINKQKEAPTIKAEAEKTEAVKDKTEAETTNTILEGAKKAIEVYADTNEHLENQVKLAREEEIQARKAATEAKKETAEVLRLLRISEQQSKEWETQYKAQVKKNEVMFDDVLDIKRRLEEMENRFSQACGLIESQRVTIAAKDSEIAELRVKLDDCRSRLPTAPFAQPTGIQ